MRVLFARDGDLQAAVQVDIVGLYSYPMNLAATGDGIGHVTIDSGSPPISATRQTSTFAKGGDLQAAGQVDIVGVDPCPINLAATGDVRGHVAIETTSRDAPW